MERFTILKMTNLSKLRYKVTALPMGVLTKVVLVFWNGSERMLDRNILELMWKNKAQEHEKHRNKEWCQRTCVTRQQNASPGRCHQTLWPGLGPGSHVSVTHRVQAQTPGPVWTEYKTEVGLPRGGRVWLVTTWRWHDCLSTWGKITVRPRVIPHTF